MTSQNGIVYILDKVSGPSFLNPNCKLFCSLYQQNPDRSLNITSRQGSTVLFPQELLVAQAKQLKECEDWQNMPDLTNKNLFELSDWRDRCQILVFFNDRNSPVYIYLSKHLCGMMVHTLAR